MMKLSNFYKKALHCVYVYRDVRMKGLFQLLLPLRIKTGIFYHPISSFYQHKFQLENILLLSRYAQNMDTIQVTTIIITLSTDVLILSCTTNSSGQAK